MKNLYIALILLMCALPCAYAFTFEEICKNAESAISETASKRAMKTLKALDGCEKGDRLELSEYVNALFAHNEPFVLFEYFSDNLMFRRYAILTEFEPPSTKLTSRNAFTMPLKDYEMRQFMMFAKSIVAKKDYVDLSEFFGIPHQMPQIFLLLTVYDGQTIKSLLIENPDIIAAKDILTTALKRHYEEYNIVFNFLCMAKYGKLTDTAVFLGPLNLRLSEEYDAR